MHCDSGEPGVTCGSWNLNPLMSQETPQSPEKLSNNLEMARGKINTKSGQNEVSS